MQDRGQVLAIAAAQTRNKDELAKKAGYSRSGYYKHIRNPKLPYHILTKYGKVLGVDFTEQFPDMPKYMMAQDPEEMLYGKPSTLEEALKHIALWRDKYVRLMERHNNLVERMNDLKHPDW